jgi:SET domain
VARILAKAVGDDSDNNRDGDDAKDRTNERGRGDRDDGEDDDDADAERDRDRARFDEEEREENKRENERNQRRYFELSSAYLRDPFARLDVRRSSIHGGGLFVRDGVVIEKDDMIVEYIGEKIRQAVADRREVQYEDEGVGSCYLFRLDKESIIDATRRGGMARFINHSCEPNAYAKVISTITKVKVKKSVGKQPSDVTECVQSASKSADCSQDAMDVDMAANTNDADRRNDEMEVANGVDRASTNGVSAKDEEDEDGGTEEEEEEVVEDKHIVIFAGRDILGGEEVTYDYKFPIEEKKLKCYCGAPRCHGSMN